jgi:hypothetical protein
VIFMPGSVLCAVPGGKRRDAQLHRDGLLLGQTTPRDRGDERRGQHGQHHPDRQDGQHHAHDRPARH